MLVVDNISRKKLNPVSLQLENGTCIAIHGRSGSGKSLMLRAIADLDPCQGCVTLDGRASSDMPAPAWRRLVTYVAAQSGWWAETVGEHFEEPDIAAVYLVRLGLDDDAINWPVSRLSTGELQRLSILRAIIQTPRVLLLDEPTSALDPEATALVEGILHEKLSDGCSIIMVTHDAAQARRMAVTSYGMVDGTLTEDTDAKR